MESNFIIERLFKYYNVSSSGDLADKMSISRQTLTNWKSRNSINAIKKKCRELGIYEKIFFDTNVQNINNMNGGQNAQNVYGNQTFDVHTNEQEIDEVTFGIVKEAFQKAVKTDKVKEFRIHLMEF